MARDERETSPRKVAESISNHPRGEEDERQDKLPPRGAAKRSAASQPQGRQEDRTPSQAEGDRATTEHNLRQQRARARR